MMCSRSSGGRTRTSGERAGRTRGGWRDRIFALELAPSAEVASGSSGGRLGSDAGKSVLDTVAAGKLGRTVSKQVEGTGTRQLTSLGTWGAEAWAGRGGQIARPSGVLSSFETSTAIENKTGVSRELGSMGENVLLDSDFFSLATWEERFSLGEWALRFSLAGA